MNKDNGRHLLLILPSRINYFHQNGMKPGQQVVEIASACVRSFHQERMRGSGFNAYFPAIQAQKNVSCEKCNVFVAVNEWVIDQQVNFCLRTGSIVTVSPIV